MRRQGSSGEGSSKGGPNSGPTDFLQLHLTGIQALPTTLGPQRPSALREPLPQHPSQDLKESLFKEAGIRELQPPPLQPWSHPHSKQLSQKLNLQNTYVEWTKAGVLFQSFPAPLSQNVAF